MDMPYSTETILKCMISALAVNHDTVLTIKDFDTILDNSHIYTGNTQKYIQPIYTATTINGIIPNASWYINGLSSPLFHERISFCNETVWKYDSKEIHEYIKNRYFRALHQITFKSTIIHEVHSFIESLKQPFIGVMIDVSVCTLDTYIQKIKEISTETGVNCIIVIDDNNLQLNTILNCHILKKPIYFNNIQYIVYRLLIMACSTYFIGYYKSVFSELVFWFSRHYTKIYPIL